VDFATKLSRFEGVLLGRVCAVGVWFVMRKVVSGWSFFTMRPRWETGLWLMLRFNFSGDGGMIFHSSDRRGSGWAAMGEW